MLDAISLTLGERVQGKPHRLDHLAAEVTCTFGISKEIANWLTDHSIEHDPAEDLVIRRIIQPDGKSRAFLNDSVITLSSLKSLAPLLVELHSQHAHYALLNKKNHGALLDDFAQLNPLVDSVACIADEYNANERHIESLLESSNDNDARVQLLSYQLEELEAAAPAAGESAELEQSLKRLLQADTIQEALQQAVSVCASDGDDSPLSLIQSARSALSQQTAHEERLHGPAQLLEAAAIQLEEAQSELTAISASLQSDPAKIAQIEKRLDVLYSLARKHKVATADLHGLAEQIAQELKALTEVDSEVANLREKQSALREDYLLQAGKLGKKRLSAAKKLELQMTKKLKQLSMAHCKFQIDITELAIETAVDPAKPQTTARLPREGMEKIELLISTVPGKPPQSLANVASGGELSRISLAIQVAISSKKGAQTLVFDEVDVGIGGAVAEVVGEMIAELGQSKQLICVTHLAQVAAKAAAHYQVEKSIGKNSVSTHIKELDNKQRKKELARMMSGVDITSASLEQAEALLSGS